MRVGNDGEADLVDVRLPTCRNSRFDARPVRGESEWELGPEQRTRSELVDSRRNWINGRQQTIGSLNARGLVGKAADRGSGFAYVRRREAANDDFAWPAFRGQEAEAQHLALLFLNHLHHGHLDLVARGGHRMRHIGPALPVRGRGGRIAGPALGCGLHRRKHGGLIGLVEHEPGPLLLGREPKVRGSRVWRPLTARGG